MLLFLKADRRLDEIAGVVSALDAEEPFESIRCPLCSWRPTAESRWCCSCSDTPEPPFDCCYTMWNTFSTRGRCPGCSHQWQWTTCLRCQQPSRHEDWYEQSG
jgi:hypothetical protein